MRIYGYVPFGYEGNIVSVEVDIRRGLPGTTIVGLAGGAVKESRERVRTAIRNSGYKYPDGRILINLAPADIPKSNASFDLAIALSILNSDKQIELDIYNEIMVIGELQLNGLVRYTSGVVPAVIEGARFGIETAIVPKLNNGEVGKITRNKIITVSSLSEAVERLQGNYCSNFHSPPVESDRSANQGALINSPPRFDVLDFSAMRGQIFMKRAMEIAAAGMHNIILVGPPGSGKTLGARCFNSILPDLDHDASLVVSRIYSQAGLLGGELITRPPFRAPHHSASTAGLLSNGIRPGEAVLANHGVLFLDEAFEFRKDALQSLRCPIEDGKVCVTRSHYAVWYPARFQLIIAANPCPCGNYGQSNKICLCNLDEVARYWKRFGGPLLDRIDIRISVTSDISMEVDDTGYSNSAEILERVKRAISRQKKRYTDLDIPRNALLKLKEIERYCPLTDELQKLLIDIARKLNLSMRAMYSIRKVARTIADIADSDIIERRHIMEAIQYRRYAENGYPV